MFQKLKHIFRHYFTPHHTNNYKARFLHMSYFITYAVLLIFLQTGTHWLSLYNPNILGYATDISVDKLLELVNKERLKNDLTPLTLSNELTSAATAKASDMFKFNYWAHVSPTGTTPWQFITGSGYKYIYAGENLAKNFDASQDVVTAWMNSPTHRANLLKPEYKEIGMAVVNGKLQGDETTLVVQEFGSRSVEVARQTDQQPIKQQTLPNYQGLADQNKNTNASTLSISSFRINKKVSIYLAEFLLGILCIDAIYMWKCKATRMSGHTLAHIIFILALLGAMGATGIGVIL
jgi:hypothetical protein